MKNQVIKFIALCGIVCGFMLNANAQDAAKQRKKMTPEQRTEMRLDKMKTELKLTDEQVPKVKEVLQAQAEMRTADKKAMKERHEKMKAELGAILTPEQMAKYNEKLEQRKQKKHSKEKK